MRNNQKKYSAQFNNEYTMKILAILQDSKESVTVADIMAALGGQLTSQKVVRLIDSVNEIMPVIRQKSNGITHYKLKAIHEEQGYDTSFYTGPKNSANFEATYFNPGEEGWVAPAFRYLYNPDGTEK